MQPQPSHLRARFAPPPGLTGGANENPMRRLRKLDLYRKVPRDLTEGSVTGGLVTAVSVLTLLLLTLAELRALMQVSRVTELVVDRSEDGAFRVNLNVTVKGLSCEFLQVDLRNALGTTREDLNDETLHKYGTDKDGTWVGSATRKLSPAINHTYLQIPRGARDHYGNERHALELDKTNFEEALEQYEVLLVDFHSPRCIHCVNFAPIFEHAAELVHEASPGKGVVRDSHKKYSVALATVDCIQNMELCRGAHIQAYPTVLVFREYHRRVSPQDRDNIYEAYQGPREANALRDFAIKVLDDVLSHDPTLGKNAYMGPSGPDVTGDGASDSTVHTPGCRVEGYLDVKRVPGSIIIRPHSRDNAHEFDTGLVNVDHTIDHLSFGLRSARDTSDDGPYARWTHGGGGKASSPPPQHDFFSVAPAAAAGAAGGGGFVGREPGHTHVHFVKVVSRTTLPLGSKPVQAYEYSIASDSFRPKDLVPHIEIAYDLSPMQILVTETRKNWADGIISILALVGGVFSASFIIETILSGIAAWIMDANGKQA